MRLIDADALMITLMDKDLDQIQDNGGLELCQIIDEQPTVKAVLPDKEVWLMGYRCGIQEMQDLEKQIINLVNNHEFHGEWRKENTI